MAQQEKVGENATSHPDSCEKSSNPEPCSTELDRSTLAQQSGGEEPTSEPQAKEEPFSVFTATQRRLIVIIASLTTLLPPLTGSMYYPVIPVMAHELHVSISAINYTITAYLIVQGIAPSFLGNLSDETGRRPALIVAFIIYIAGCIGAAFKNNYTILIITRCLQSAGSSATIAISLATVSDIVTSAQRGSYTSYVQMGWMVENISATDSFYHKIIGGILTHYLGWRSIFWFLTIFASTVFLILLLFMPETSRPIVGNGSIPPAFWNKPLIAYMSPARRRKDGDQRASVDVAPGLKSPKRTQFSPWKSLQLFGQKEMGILLLYSGMIYATSYVIVSTMAAILQQHYGLSTIQVSLCYLATGFGTMASVVGTGRFLDWNFRRHATRLGLEISKQKQQDLVAFPIEIARLQITFPMLIVAGTSLLIYGWTIQVHAPLAVPLIFLFFASLGIASSFSGLNNLLMDLNRTKSGTASAAMNISRCWMGAGAVALGSFINKVGGSGWMSFTITGIWLVFSPLPFIVMRYGPRWRGERRASEA